MCVCSNVLEKTFKSIPKRVKKSDKFRHSSIIQAGWEGVAGAPFRERERVEATRPRHKVRKNELMLLHRYTTDVCGSYNIDTNTMRGMDMPHWMYSKKLSNAGEVSLSYSHAGK